MHYTSSSNILQSKNRNIFEVVEPERCSKVIKNSGAPWSVKWEGLAACWKGGQRERREGAQVAGVI